MDPKIRNLLIFVIPRIVIIGSFGYGCFYLINSPVYSSHLTNNVILNVVALLTILILAWRTSLTIIRRLLIPAKHPLSYGNWAIITGSTAGIGEEFASHLHSMGMSLLLISRSEDKLQKQVAQLEAQKNKTNNGTIKYLVYDFTNQDPSIRSAFYSTLRKECSEMSDMGGLGLLINNVGMANDIPKSLNELTDEECDNLINCNIHSTVFMTKTVLSVMKAQKKGAIISISSGSGNHPGPFISVYSATKAFITQFSRSMHVECWGSGVDFLVVTPFYIVSNLYKRKSGTIIAPMPETLVKGTLAQLGKQYVWQGHGYWFHGLLGNLASYYPETTRRWRKMMVDNRSRYDAKNNKSK